MHVVVIQNDPISTIDLMGQWMDEVPNVDWVNYQAFAGQVPTLAECCPDALIVLGGRPNALQDDQYPYLAKVRTLINEAVANSVPMLGICLGMQMLAATCGGRVAISSPLGPERGQVHIKWEETAAADPVIGPVALRFPAGAWVSVDHSDGVRKLPVLGQALGRSDRYLQAMRVGSAVGVQFHPEVGEHRLRQWARSNGEDEAKVLGNFRIHEEQLMELGRTLTRSFLREAGAKLDI